VLLPPLHRIGVWVKSILAVDGIASRGDPCVVIASQSCCGGASGAAGAGAGAHAAPCVVRVGFSVHVYVRVRVRVRLCGSVWHCPALQVGLVAYKLIMIEMGDDTGKTAGVSSTQFFIIGALNIIERVCFLLITVAASAAAAAGFLLLVSLWSVGRVCVYRTLLPP
jgi:hypothetical protein